MISRAIQRYTEAFVFVVVAFAVLGWFFPEAFRPLATYIRAGLGAIMFGMGMTLQTEDFQRVIRMPRAVGVGIAAQFIVMPIAAYAIAAAAQLDPALAMGFIILGACPGGTASNVVAYLAKADVALSVTMTAVSTVAAVFMTPMWISWMGGQYLPVDAWAMLWSVATIVLLPVAGGFIVRLVLNKLATRMLAVFPSISVTAVGIIVAIIVALQREAIAQSGAIIIMLALCHNVLGITIGYGIGWMAQLPVTARRTIAIEVGMQNSGLGMVLANTHFAGTAASVPSAVFSVIHNITGSGLASWWSTHLPKPTLVVKAAEPTEAMARRVMAWRNDAVTLAMSFTQTPKEWPAFMDEFCEEYFSCEGLPPLFAYDGDAPAAFVRFRDYEDEEFVGRCVDIGIIVDPEKRGRGYAVPAIRAAVAFSMDRGAETIIAEIKDGNTASIRAFRGAGFDSLDAVTKSLADGGGGDSIKRFIYPPRGSQ